MLSGPWATTSTIGVRAKYGWSPAGTNKAKRSKASPRRLPDCERRGGLELPLGRASVHNLHCHLGFDLARHSKPARRRSAAMVRHLPVRHLGRGNGNGCLVEGAAPASPSRGHSRGALHRLHAILREPRFRLFRGEAPYVGCRRNRIRPAPHPEQPPRLGLSRTAPHRALCLGFARRRDGDRPAVRPRASRA